MAIYKFKVTFEDFDDISRVIDIKSTQTFEDLHRAIHKSTGYNVEKSSSFYVSTDNWIKGEEIAFLPAERKKDRVVLMQQAKLSKYIDDPHQKFYYIYNFERPYDFHVELIKISLETDPNIEYPFISKSTGIAPKIFEKNTAVDDDDDAVVANNEFDFLNDMDFVPEDADDLEAMNDYGINEEEAEEEEEESDEYNGFSGDADESENEREDY